MSRRPRLSSAGPALPGDLQRDRVGGSGGRIDGDRGVARVDVPDVAWPARDRDGKCDRGVAPAADVEGGAVERSAPASAAVDRRKMTS